MIRRPPRSTQSRSSAASDVYKRQSEPRPSGGEAPERGGRFRWGQGLCDAAGGGGRGGGGPGGRGTGGDAPGRWATRRNDPLCRGRECRVRERGGRGGG